MFLELVCQQRFLDGSFGGTTAAVRVSVGTVCGRCMHHTGRTLQAVVVDAGNLPIRLHVPGVVGRPRSSPSCLPADARR